MTASSLPLTRFVHGAPGVIVESTAPARRLGGVRRDLAAFAGVAPRGPARVPTRSPAPDETVLDYLTGVSTTRSVAVEIGSWSEYRRRFGGFEGAGRLPYAVSAFFAQGGRRARVIRPEGSLVPAIYGTARAHASVC